MSTPVTRRDVGLARTDGHSATEFAAHQNTAADIVTLSPAEQAVADARDTLAHEVNNRIRAVQHANAKVDEATIEVVAASVVNAYPDAVSATVDVAGISSHGILYGVRDIQSDASVLYEKGVDPKTELIEELEKHLSSLSRNSAVLAFDDDDTAILAVGGQVRADSAILTAAGELGIHKLIPSAMTVARTIAKLDDAKLATITDDDLEYIYNDTLYTAVRDVTAQLESASSPDATDRITESQLSDLTDEIPVMRAVLQQVRHSRPKLDPKILALLPADIDRIYDNFVKAHLEDFAFAMEDKYGIDR